MATSKKESKSEGKKEKRGWLEMREVTYDLHVCCALASGGRRPSPAPVRTYDELAHAHANTLDASDAYVYL